MKRRFFRPALIGLAVMLVGVTVGLGAAWFRWGREPGVEFAGYRTIPAAGRVAVFRMVNPSAVAFNYIGHSDTFPAYRCRTPAPDGWRENLVGWCGVGMSRHTLEPRAVREFQVPVGRYTPGQQFSVGVQFQRGRAEEMEAAVQPPRSRVAEFYEWLRARLRPADAAWSAAVVAGS
jgi:hypothetical protein